MSFAWQRLGEEIQAQPLPWALAAVLGVLWLLALLGWWRARRRLAVAVRRRQKLARRAEKAAERLLRRAGYSILGRQVLQHWTLRVNGRRRKVSSRVDLLVEKGGRRFVADVKTGDQAPNPAQPATRRQLLEYRLVFQVDGALVIDMVERQILEVDLPFDPGN